MIDAYQSLPVDRPFTAPGIRRNSVQPKNFLVRVFRNGDSSRCAYCASCTMNIILVEATRKLQLVRPARRLFDDNGHEIFQSEDIKRSPFSEDSSTTSDPPPIVPNLPRHLKHKSIQTDDEVWPQPKLKAAHTQTDEVIKPQPKMKVANTQTDEVTKPPPNKNAVDKQTDEIIKLQPKMKVANTQTDEVTKPPPNKNAVDTQTDEIIKLQPKMEVANTQTDEVTKPSPNTKAADTQTDEVTKPSTYMKVAGTQTDEVIKLQPNMKSIYTQTHEKTETINRNRWTSMLDDSPIEHTSKNTQTAWNNQSKATQTGQNILPTTRSS
ncbi:unnamed protein product [Rotaria sordida]|uniref:Uncharacterized protein n=2 Tax=Rotaria sordida TaxID=392033 RepID=A0A814HVS8_9BILA|nr:unnamed protein product [Rotaria sordida]